MFAKRGFANMKKIVFDSKNLKRVFDLFDGEANIIKTRHRVFKRLDMGLRPLC